MLNAVICGAARSRRIVLPEERPPSIIEGLQEHAELPSIVIAKWGRRSTNFLFRGDIGILCKLSPIERGGPLRLFGKIHRAFAVWRRERD